MSYEHIEIPASGDKITVENNKLVVTDNPILGFVEGDGIGGDITRASMRVWNAAVEKAYGGKRKVHWAELFLGEKAAGIYDGNYFPDETLEAVKDLIEKSFSEPLYRDDLASSVDLSPDHLGRMFKRLTGEKISDYINRLRIEEACRRLRQNNHKIIDIAFDVGFENLRTFNLCFSKTSGMSPSEFRRSIEE